MLLQQRMKQFKVVLRTSYHDETTVSRPICEVKHHWASLVLRWVTTGELDSVVSNFLFDSIFLVYIAIHYHRIQHIHILQDISMLQRYIHTRIDILCCCILRSYIRIHYDTEIDHHIPTYNTLYSTYIKDIDRLEDTTTTTTHYGWIFSFVYL